MPSSTSSTEKVKPSVAKFEEFFSSKYKDTVFLRPLKNKEICGSKLFGTRNVRSRPCRSFNRKT